jgi:hypothetical protein
MDLETKLVDSKFDNRDIGIKCGVHADSPSRLLSPRAMSLNQCADLQAPLRSSHTLLA